jgi:hypothetical protein
MAHVWPFGVRCARRPDKRNRWHRPGIGTFEKSGGACRGRWTRGGYEFVAFADEVGDEPVWECAVDGDGEPVALVEVVAGGDRWVRGAE